MFLNPHTGGEFLHFPEGTITLHSGTPSTTTKATTIATTTTTATTTTATTTTTTAIVYNSASANVA